jgi:peptide deformylase
MAILAIRTHGDPVLREKTRPVERFDRSLRRLVEDMLETMYDAPGVGLAAPQVGIAGCFFVYDDQESTGPGFLANAELLETVGELVQDEGCLSIPGPFHPTARALGVKVRGQDLKGREILVEGEGLLARILQHEIDHTNGMLFIDRLDDEGRREVMRLMRERELRGVPGEARSPGS